MHTHVSGHISNRAFLKKVKLQVAHLPDLRVPDNLIVEIGNTVVLVNYDTHYPAGSDLQTGVYVP